jgi:hypothetical protein
MSTPQKYPLEQLITIRKNQFDQAVKILEEKKALLEKAIKKLEEVTKERDIALKLKKDKLTQLRATMDEGSTSDKIQLMKSYLKNVVEPSLLEKQKKVDDQKKVVDLAEKQVEIATQEMYQKKKDLEKIEIGKVEWNKENQKIIQKKENSEQDEQGSITHTTRKREFEKRQE